MSWYRQGAVSVVQNSTTVTGAGTEFAANSRVGDGFVGPDGREYEVTNIASETVLSILPAYMGASLAAGTYAITPIQGYPKKLADSFNNLSERFGSILALLGETATLEGVRESLNLVTTDGLPAGEVNKYLTNSGVLASVLNGLDLSTSGALSATDTLISALGKLQATKADLSAQNKTVAITQGGTGAKTAPEARAALGVLNVDSTYISGLKLIWNNPGSISVGTGCAVIPLTGQMLSVDAPVTLSGLALGTGLVHVYLYNNNGTPALELTGAAPFNYRGSAWHKNLAAGYRYLGSVVSLNNAIVRFVHNPIDNRISILAVAFGGPFQVLAAGSAQAPTFVGCGGVVPPTAITVQSLLINVGTSVANIASDSGVSSQEYPMALAAGDRLTYDMAMDSAQRIVYYCSASGGSLYINIVGYNFMR